jgi:pentatricopeptide repeat domain-containing protein 1
MIEKMRMLHYHFSNIISLEVIAIIFVTSSMYQDGKLHSNQAQTEKETKQNCLICTKENSCHTVRTRTSEMKSLIHQNKPHEVHAIYKTLIDQGHIPSIVTYTTLLMALTGERRFELIPKLMSQVEKTGIKPDFMYYNVVLNAFSEGGKINEAMSVFWNMKASGCQPTTSTFNTLIKGYAIAG